MRQGGLSVENVALVTEVRPVLPDRGVAAHKDKSPGNCAETRRPILKPRPQPGAVSRCNWPSPVDATGPTGPFCFTKIGRS